jgi:lipopolysaccharide/colanic/teichoic acid biosynthesis glycosyltransferase
LHRISSESISASGSASLTDHAVAPHRSVLVPPTPVAESAGRAIQLALKRAVDVVGAGLGLLLLAPLMITLAILIRAGSSGPVFFRQTRTGLDGRPFEILKFRSMYTDRCDISGVAQTVKDDPRVTPIGRVMRRTNLDELPQLINVLRGDMSLVGPRPHVPGMLAAGILYEDLVPGYEQRHRMRPGITGLAQVNGLRGPTIERKPAVDRVMNDFAYVREFSLWLDIKILVKTLASELRGATGY